MPVLGRHHDRRPAAQGGDGRQPQRLLLHARPRHRRAARRQAVHRHEVGARGRDRTAPIVLNDGVIPPGGSEATTPCVPDFRGGTVFNPPSYDPALQLFFVMARETCAYYTPQQQEMRGRPQLHGRRHAQAAPSPTYSALRAIDPKTGDDQVGAQVPDVVAGRRDVHGVGPRVRRRSRRLLQRLRVARAASCCGRIAPDRRSGARRQ